MHNYFNLNRYKFQNECAFTYTLLIIFYLGTGTNPLKRYLTNIIQIILRSTV